MHNLEGVYACDARSVGLRPPPLPRVMTVLKKNLRNSRDFLAVCTKIKVFVDSEERMNWISLLNVFMLISVDLS